jgi:hypothetical protein
MSTSVKKKMSIELGLSDLFDPNLINKNLSVGRRASLSSSINPPGPTNVTHHLLKFLTIVTQSRFPRQNLSGKELKSLSPSAVASEACPNPTINDESTDIAIDELKKRFDPSLTNAARDLIRPIPQRRVLNVRTMGTTMPLVRQRNDRFANPNLELRKLRDANVS